MISNRIRKKNLIREAPHFKTQQNRALLDVFQLSDRLFKMPSYNNYINSNIPFYKVSLQKFFQYAEYIHLNRSGYNILRYSLAELLAILQQYQKAKVEFKKVMERISYLSKQKKI